MDCSLPVSSVHGILQQEHWSGLPCPAPGDLPDPGIEPRSPYPPGNRPEQASLLLGFLERQASEAGAQPPSAEAHVQGVLTLHPFPSVTSPGIGDPEAD